MQFGINVCHELIPLVSDCEVDTRISGALVIQNLFMFALFTEFYVKNYVKKRPQLEKKDT